MSGDPDQATLSAEERLRLCTDIAAAYVSNNDLVPADVPEMIRSVYASIAALGASSEPVAAPEPLKPAVPIGKSIQHDHLVCLEDGKRLKMLKRYLRAKFDLTPDAYRRRWGLPTDYPMVAPAYAARRSEFAKQIGLGRGVRRGA